MDLKQSSIHLVVAAPFYVMTSWLLLTFEAKLVEENTILTADVW